MLSLPPQANPETVVSARSALCLSRYGDMPEQSRSAAHVPLRITTNAQCKRHILCPELSTVNARLLKSTKAHQDHVHASESPLILVC